MAKRKKDNTLLIVGAAAVAAYLVYSNSQVVPVQQAAVPGAGLNPIPSTGQLLPGDPGRVNAPPVYRDVTPVINPVIRYDGSGRPVISTA